MNPDAANNWWIAGATAVFLMLGATYARSHELYRDFYSSGVPGLGRWCCNGNAEGTTGDCAPAEYRMLRDGSYMMRSKRYPDKEIHVAKDKILWLSLPGGEAFEAHLCAVPRQAGTLPTDEDPDPEFTTLCAAINPRGF